MRTLPLGDVDVRDRHRSAIAAERHFFETASGHFPIEHDGAVATPASAVAARRVGQQLRCAAGYLHALQSSLGEERDKAAVRRPEWRPCIVGGGKRPSRCHGERTQPKLLPAIGPKGNKGERPPVR